MTDTRYLYSDDPADHGPEAMARARIEARRVARRQRKLRQQRIRRAALRCIGALIAVVIVIAVAQQIGGNATTQPDTPAFTPPAEIRPTGIQTSDEQPSATQPTQQAQQTELPLATQPTEHTEPIQMPELEPLEKPIFISAQNVPAADETDTPADTRFERTLLEQGYLSDDVPMPYEYQGWMRRYCAEYGCPYKLALAVAEIESHFNMSAIGGVGEVGMMQLNPGPGGSYHAELKKATGLDPTTPEGNIACACYLLGKYMAKYGDPAKAVMAYRMGASGADKALARGADPLTWAGGDMEAMARWERIVSYPG